MTTVQTDTRRKGGSGPRKKRNQASATRPGIGLKLYQLRSEAGLSQVELRDATKAFDPTGTGLSDTSICRLESNAYTPRASTVKLLSGTLTKLLKRPITMDELYGGGGSLALTAFLERERSRRRMTVPVFAEHIGVQPGRYEAVRDGTLRFNGNDLGAIVRALPATSPLVSAAVAEFDGGGANGNG